MFAPTMRSASLSACMWMAVLAALAIGSAQGQGERRPNKKAPAVNARPHSVTLTWAHPRKDEAIKAFNVYRADASKGSGGTISCSAKFEKIAVVKMPATRYRDVAVAPRRSYCYAVTSVSARGESHHSARVVATVP
jgi:fibronectin type 3 domain-containing protein